LSTTPQIQIPRNNPALNPLYILFLEIGIEKVRKKEQDWKEGGSVGEDQQDELESLPEELYDPNVGLQQNLQLENNDENMPGITGIDTNKSLPNQNIRARQQLGRSLSPQIDVPNLEVYAREDETRLRPQRPEKIPKYPATEREVNSIQQSSTVVVTTPYRPVFVVNGPIERPIFPSTVNVSSDLFSKTTNELEPHNTTQLVEATLQLTQNMSKSNATKLHTFPVDGFLKNDNHTSVNHPPPFIPVSSVEDSLSTVNRVLIVHSLAGCLVLVLIVVLFAFIREIRGRRQQRRHLLSEVVSNNSQRSSPIPSPPSLFRGSNWILRHPNDDNRTMVVL